MKYLKTFGIILAIMITLFLISITLSYFNIINDTANDVIKLLSMLISSFSGGIYIGSQSQEKGYLEGIKISGILLIILITLSFLVFKDNLSIWKIIYYILILIVTITGSIIGINKKEKHN